MSAHALVAIGLFSLILCLTLVCVTLVLQEIWPSGPNGPQVTLGDFVRDLLLEQVRVR